MDRWLDGWMAIRLDRLMKENLNGWLLMAIILVDG